MLTRTVLRTISRSQLLGAGDRVLVGLSGGADSVCLAHALNGLSGRLGIEVHTAHVNHGVRDDAASDADFSRDVAHRLDLPFDAVTLDVFARARASGRSLEDEARRARYEALDAIAARRSCSKIAVGHTLDDQAETVLMRLCRGSGTQGLAGIHPLVALDSGREVVRPLLETRARDVRRYLSERGLEHREDPTNDDLRFTRNLVRHEVLPGLAAALNPRLAETLAATAELRRDEEDFLDALTDHELAERARRESSGWVLETSHLAETHPALARRLVRRVARETKGSNADLTKQHVDSVLRLALEGHSGRELHLPGVTVVRSFETLRFLASPEASDDGSARQRENGYNKFEYRFTIPSRLQVWECQGWLSAELDGSAVSTRGYGDAAGNAVTVAVEESLKELKVRSSEPSDRFHPLGAPGKKRLSRYLMERRVASETRRRVPVVVRADTEELLWVVGHGISERARVVDGTRPLRLEWNPS